MKFLLLLYFHICIMEFLYYIFPHITARSLLKHPQISTYPYLTVLLIMKSLLYMSTHIYLTVLWNSSCRLSFISSRSCACRMYASASNTALFVHQVARFNAKSSQPFSMSISTRRRNISGYSPLRRKFCAERWEKIDLINVYLG